MRHLREHSIIYKGLLTKRGGEPPKPESDQASGSPIYKKCGIQNNTLDDTTVSHEKFDKIYNPVYSNNELKEKERRREHLARQHMHFIWNLILIKYKNFF